MLRSGKIEEAMKSSKKGLDIWKPMFSQFLTKPLCVEESAISDGNNIQKVG